METIMDERKSLEVIQKMMNRGKKNFKEGSIFYLIWGWAAFAAGLIEFFLLKIDYEYHWAVWPVFMTIGAVTSAIVGHKKGKKQKFVTFTDLALKYIWIGFVVYLFMVLAMSSKIGWLYSYVLIVGLYGLGTFISGGVLQFRPLIVGGLLSLLMSFAAIILSHLFQEFSNVLLLLCASLVVSYLIPGYMLRSKDLNHAA